MAMTIEIGGFPALVALIIELFVWLKADISSLCQEIHRAFDELRRDMQQEIAELRERLEKRLDGLNGSVHRARSPSTITGETRNSRVNGLLSGMPGAVCQKSHTRRFLFAADGSIVHAY